MKKILVPLSLAGLVLSGCSTVKYDCELKDIPAAKCASMDESYRTSATTPGPITKNRQSVFERSGMQVSAPTDRGMSDKPFFKGEDSGFPEAGERGMPVFRQPEVHRVWVAPYVDGDGNLRTGEYTYFSTPGQWNYGTTTRPGEGSAIFGPGRPGQLGFTPVVTPKAPPAAPPSNQSGSLQSANKAVQATPTDRVDDITQPMQRIGQ